jgi:endonuclease YncB( thermonuclease family)
MIRRVKVYRACILFVFVMLTAVTQAYAACGGEEAGRGVVTEISGGETLVLDDGRAIRLTGILGPKRAAQGPASEARDEMEKALSDLTLGKQVSLRIGERKRDRYGRLLAHVMLVDEAGGETEWVQGRLVADGFARVISFEDNRLCVSELLTLEEAARHERKGLWGNGFFAVRPAMAEDQLYRLAQSYEIVEGRVVDVAAVKGRTYLNFGKDWKRDFTAFVPAKTAGMFGLDGAGQGPGITLADLAGKHIRVRGWLRNYNGPSITVSHPEQIELVETGNDGR